MGLRHYVMSVNRVFRIVAILHENPAGDSLQQLE